VRIGRSALFHAEHGSERVTACQSFTNTLALSTAIAPAFSGT
jgi:hypothetical protein